MTADFALNIRRAPMRLDALARRHPQLWERFNASVCRELQAVQPYGPEVQQALRVHAGMELPQVTAPCVGAWV